MWHHERNENPTEQERAMASVISERNGAVQRLQLNEPDSMNPFAWWMHKQCPLLMVEL
jgi:hypothetical protein